MINRNITIIFVAMMTAGILSIERIKTNAKCWLHFPFVISIIATASCGLFPPEEDAYLKNYAEAHDYMLENRPDKAIPIYKKALKQKEDFLPVYQELAVCYQQIGETDSAILYYEGAIAYNPRNVDAYQAIGNIYYIEGDHDEALIWYDRGSEVDELYPRSYNNMATIWLSRNNLKIARKYYEKAIAVDATYPRAYYGLGIVAMKEGNLTGAESRFLDAFKVGSMPEAIYMLGQLYYGQKEHEKALVWFRKYLEKETTGQWADKAKDMIFLLEQELPVDK